MRAEGLNKNFFYLDLCSVAKYAHFKNCTEIYTKDQNSLVGLKTLIDTNRHIYLRDHVFKEECFVPATMIMEIFVEAGTWFAEYFLGGKDKHKTVIGLEDLFIERAIAIQPGSGIEILILLKEIKKNTDAIKMKTDIVSKRINKEGKIVGERLNATCNIIISDSNPYIKNIEIPEIEYDFYNFSPAAYYRYYFPSLGRMFQSQTGRIAISKDRNVLVGEYNCSDLEKDFIKDQESSFLISPLGYDSCVQYIVFLSRVKTIIGRLPIGGKRINICSDHPRFGNIRTLVKCLDIDDDIMKSNIWSFKNDGELIMSSEEFLIRKSPFHRYENKEEFERIMEENRIENMDW